MAPYLTHLSTTLAQARLNLTTRIIHIRTGFRAGYPDLHPRNPSFARVVPKATYTEHDPESQFHPLVEPQTGDLVVTKRRVSAFTGTDLELLLRSLGTEQVVVVGLITSGAVLSTVRQAADLDFGVTVLRDLCMDREEDVHEVLMEKVFSRQARVVDSGVWLEGL
ncbi:isochorismatase family protein [Aspergillus campestris IBT 28561]|uniref:Isochorismatase family protein n=1 Tax=Aspergillus campestris (strain IBT 28561) TaxID=1392248 RepID=A0A2I1CQI4_ASPC2|nr:isochorismatase family protein [Aspergillus campestris IBT 28561]PKX99867.1 isochorismatase family protein [Aspergillus campestris IBT 28561]